MEFACHLSETLEGIGNCNVLNGHQLDILEPLSQRSYQRILRQLSRVPFGGDAYHGRSVTLGECTALLLTTYGTRKILGVCSRTALASKEGPDEILGALTCSNDELLRWSGPLQASAKNAASLEKMRKGDLVPCCDKQRG
jgi:hypothetical protein